MARLINGEYGALPTRFQNVAAWSDFAHVDAQTCRVDTSILLLNLRQSRLQRAASGFIALEAPVPTAAHIIPNATAKAGLTGLPSPNGRCPARPVSERIGEDISTTTSSSG
jgi:hypothetical protein